MIHYQMDLNSFSSSLCVFITQVDHVCVCVCPYLIYGCSSFATHIKTHVKLHLRPADTNAHKPKLFFILSHKRYQTNNRQSSFCHVQEITQK